MRRLHGILDAHWGYSALIYFSGAGKGRRVFIKERSGIKMGDRILEIGCGPGTNIEYMPEKVTYTGCDYNPDYIDSANKRYAGRGTFLCLSVDDLPASPGRQSGSHTGAGSPSRVAQWRRLPGMGTLLDRRSVLARPFHAFHRQGPLCAPDGGVCESPPRDVQRCCFRVLHDAGHHLAPERLHPESNKDNE
jgi:SAM-dependent methyltransferase